MNKPVFYIIFLFWFFTSKAQENLVPNGSFEDYNNCPSFADGFYIDACGYWTSPTLASPDYFNSCSQDQEVWGGYIFSVPQNYYGFGSQYAEEGNAYAGLVFSQNSDTTQAYSEYIQVQLKRKLESGKCYQLKFYVHNPSTTCVNSIGALFSSFELNFNHDTTIHLTPQFESNAFICDTNDWMQLTYEFVSNGTEEFLSIGNFKTFNRLLISDYNGNLLAHEFIYAYYYIDNISLVETECNFPNVFTPNNDGVNDLWDIDYLYPIVENLIIVNRWGNLVFESETSLTWDGTIKNEPAPDGVYYFIIKFKNKTKKTGFISLVR